MMQKPRPPPTSCVPVTPVRVANVEVPDDGVPLPVPSSPAALSPTQRTLLSLSITHVALVLTATWLIVKPEKDNVGIMPGVCEIPMFGRVLLDCPHCDLAFSPQQRISVPPTRTAQVCSAPALLTMLAVHAPKLRLRAVLASVTSVLLA